MALMMNEDNQVHTAQVEGRTIAVCHEQVYFSDGAPALGPSKYCGTLIDVTGRQPSADEDCGNPKNHIISGPDAVVLP